MGAGLGGRGHETRAQRASDGCTPAPGAGQPWLGARAIRPPPVTWASDGCTDETPRPLGPPPDSGRGRETQRPYAPAMGCTPCPRSRASRWTRGAGSGGRPRSSRLWGGGRTSPTGQREMVASPTPRARASCLGGRGHETRACAAPRGRGSGLPRPARQRWVHASPRWAIKAAASCRARWKAVAVARRPASGKGRPLGGAREPASGWGCCQRGPALGGSRCQGTKRVAVGRGSHDPAPTARASAGRGSHDPAPRGLALGAGLLTPPRMATVGLPGSASARCSSTWSSFQPPHPHE